MNVVIVGGGIVGLAAAYYLRDRGVDVVICERSSVGSGSTPRAVGGIRAQFSTPPNVRLSLAAMEVWSDFEELFGESIGYRKNGYLFLAREEETAARLRETADMQRSEGVPAETVSPEAATEHAPGIHAEKYRLASYSLEDGHADPHLAAQAFKFAAQDAGVEIRTDTPVTAIHRDGDGNVTGVSTPDDRIDADFVVNAAGPWAHKVGEMVDLDLPISPQRRQVAVVDPVEPVPEDVPLTFDMDTGVYFLPDTGGDALVGGHFGTVDERDPDDYPTDYDLEWAMTALERAADCADYFGLDAGIKQGWSGLYAVTPDHHPILEETIPGFVNAVGFSGHGFMHAPATGQIVAEIVADGEPSLVDVSALTLDRFDGDSRLDERNVL
jgi:sarcosine oxidase subunit beta